MPVALYLMPPARNDGLGNAAGMVSLQVVTLAVVAGAAALMIFGPGPALITGGLMAAAASALGFLAMRRIGGQTGDVLGAMQQVAELTGWLALSALLGQG